MYSIYRYIMIAVLHVCTGNSLWIPTHPPSLPFSKKDSRLRYRATGGASTRSVMTLGASFQTWPMELDSRSLANNNRNRNNWQWTSFKMRTLYSKGCVWNATLHYLSLPEASNENMSKSSTSECLTKINQRPQPTFAFFDPPKLSTSILWMTAALGTLKTPSQNTEKHLSTRVLKSVFWEILL